MPHRATPDKPGPGMERGGTQTQQVREAAAAAEERGWYRGRRDSHGHTSVTGNQCTELRMATVSLITTDIKGLYIITILVTLLFVLRMFKIM